MKIDSPRESAVSMTGLPRRAAIFIDFDNVFNLLYRRNREAALAFAEKPSSWLSYFEGNARGASQRSLLLRCCYMNVTGGMYVAAGATGKVGLNKGAENKNAASIRKAGKDWISYWRFERSFVQAGFTIINCPKLTGLKNAADIKMAIDIIDSIAHPTIFEDYIVLAADTDMVPVLLRLRANNRRTLFMVRDPEDEKNKENADTFKSIVDTLRSIVDTLVVDTEFERAVLAASSAKTLLVAPPGAKPSAGAPGDTGPNAAEGGVSTCMRAGEAALPMAGSPDAKPADLVQKIISVVRTLLDQNAEGWMRLSATGSKIRQKLPELNGADWPGGRKLPHLLREADQPDIKLAKPKAEPGTRSLDWIVYNPERAINVPPLLEESEVTAQSREESREDDEDSELGAEMTTFIKDVISSLDEPISSEELEARVLKVYSADQIALTIGSVESYLLEDALPDGPEV